MGRLIFWCSTRAVGLEKDVTEDYAMVLNRDSQVNLVKMALPVLNDGGRIVFVTSHLAHFHGEKPVMEEIRTGCREQEGGRACAAGDDSGIDREGHLTGCRQR